MPCHLGVDGLVSICRKGCCADSVLGNDALGNNYGERLWDMTVKEFMEQLKRLPADAEIQIEFLSAIANASYSAEPKLARWENKVLILTGKRVK